MGSNWTNSKVLLRTFLRVETFKPYICLHNTVQYSTLLYCTVLYCTVQYCTAQYSTVQYPAAMEPCIPAQYSPWGPLAAEIDFAAYFCVTLPSIECYHVVPPYYYCDITVSGPLAGSVCTISLQPGNTNSM